ncbi:MAG TPA: SpoIID/LytB domain-containing protein [Patescibacteria group bacterium]
MPTKRIARGVVALLLVIGVVATAFSSLWTISFALDPVEELQQEINELEHLKKLSEDATKPLEGQLGSLEARIKNAQNGIAQAKQDADKLADDIVKREEELAVQYTLLSKRIAERYKRSRTFSPLTLFLATANASRLTKDLAYRSSVEAQDNRLITELSGQIEGLEKDRKALEERQVQLAALQTQLDGQAEFFRTEIAKAKDYQQSLGSQIAALSAKQQEIVNSRSGTFTASIGDSELADDYNASIKGFRESAPPGSFAVFSFGAHTHRKGMSQYGARGRAQAGQDFKQILKAYYGKEPVSKDTGGSIKVAGYGEMDFETTYLYGIAEMPSSWSAEALKAQAVAARTYAYRYKIEGKEICTTEACQVFNKSKSDNAPESWKNAVNATKGQVLEDVVTFYASTHGGYASPIGWDTTDGSGGSNFVDKSYDKIGGSPWVYKAWYTKGYSSSSDKCGRANPWLTGEELADIINAARYRDDRVTPVTTSCWGGNPYSHEELRAKSDGPSRVTSVRVAQGNGSTSQVIFQTDKGEITLSGSDFKTAFNLRAPGYLSIPQSSFAFFNIEQK